MRACSGRVAAFVVCALATAMPLHAAPVSPAPQEPGKAWDQAFPLAHPAQPVHFRAIFRDAHDQPHTLEVWRYGEHFLHRRTDDAVDLYAAPQHEPGGALHYRLVDHRQKTVIDVSRNNLFRIGVLTDWYGLAHVLDRSRGGQVQVLKSALGDTAVGTCRWRRLTRPGEQGQRIATDICWSADWGLPLLIREEDTKAPPRFAITTVEALPAHAAEMPPSPVGYRLLDANEDIDPQSD